MVRISPHAPLGNSKCEPGGPVNRTGNGTESAVNRRGEAALPTQHGQFRVVAYAGEDGKEHLAVVHGDPTSVEPLPVRLHSSCVTGDVFASLRCDCGEQLAAALDRITATGAGIVLYLDQEGRGIGLANKIAAYEHQDAGADTVDANTMLGLPVDGRNYAPAAAMLRDLGVSSIALMTNNPKKASALRDAGVAVSRAPIEIEPNPHNRAYLQTKSERLGHELSPPD